MCSAKDFGTRKCQAWNACNKLEKVWRINLPNEFKLDLFENVVEPIIDIWFRDLDVKSKRGETGGRLLHQPSSECAKYILEIAFYIVSDMGVPPLSVPLAKRKTQFAGRAFHAKGKNHI